MLHNIAEYKKEEGAILTRPSHTFKQVQEQRFLTYIDYMYKHSSWWRSILQQRGIENKNLPRSLKDITCLPILNRRLLLDWNVSGEQLIPESQRFNTVSTSGTSGKPLRIDYSKQAVNIGWGLLGLRTLALMGIDVSEQGIMLTSFEEDTKTSHSSHVNTLALKAILGDKLIDQPIGRPLNESLDLLIKNKVTWIGTVPVFYNASTIRAQERGIDLSKLGVKTLFYGGVNFPEQQRAAAARAYNAEVLGFYPSSELCAAGSQISANSETLRPETPKDTCYVLYNDYIIFEILDDNDSPVREGEIGRIIATPLFMDGTPIIRYEIGDHARFEGTLNNLMLVSNIKRANALYFSNAKFHHYEVQEMQQDLTEKTSAPISGIQIAKVIGDRQIDQPIIRIETRNSLDPPAQELVTKTAIDCFKKNEHIDVLLKRGVHGGIHKPIVEFYNFRQLVDKGAFKPKLTSDETDLWSSYAFYQHNVQEHMSPIAELADKTVADFSDCQSALDIGCGAGYFATRLADAGMKVDAIDTNKSMLRYAKKRAGDQGVLQSIIFHNRSAQDTGLPSNSRDAVHISNFLCYLDDPLTVLKEAKRILKHGGTLSLSEPRKGVDNAAVSLLANISKKDVAEKQHILPFFNAFVKHNSDMVSDMKSLYSTSEMESKLRDLSFDVIKKENVYAGVSYHLLANAIKRAEFSDGVLNKQPFELAFTGRTNQQGTLLDFNEPGVPPSEKVNAALEKFIQRGNLQRYSGCAELPEKIAHYAHVRESEVLVTNGSFQAIDIIFRSTVRPGDKVIILDPTFPGFEHCAKLQEAVITKIPFGPNGEFPLQKIISHMDPSTKLIVICNPNNPTGSLITDRDIQKILQTRKQTTVLVDEAYYEYCACTCKDFVQNHPNLIITRTFSKAFGLASLRAGYIISNQHNIQELKKLTSPFDCNVCAQIAASAALDDLEHMRTYVNEVASQSRPMLESFLREHAVDFIPSAANHVYLKCDDPNRMYEKLLDQSIFVAPQYSNIIGNGIRITVGTVQQTKDLITALSNALPYTTKNIALHEMPKAKSI